MTNKFPNFERLVGIMERLRAPGGCPWDREQTHKSIIRYLLEETYEVIDAIEEGTPEDLKEELGDLLLQVVFHAQMASEAGQFTIDDVAKGISDKMEHRHPHVFGDVKVNSAAEVLDNWEELKKIEKSQKGKKPHDSVLDGVPASWPALFENYKISKKVAKLGFDWQKPADVLNKVDEELAELRQAISEGDAAHLEEELGDLLFVAANACRVNGINPEMALRQANKKFRRRFATLEKTAAKRELKLKELSFAQWDELWNEVKKK